MNKNVVQGKQILQCNINLYNDLAQLTSSVSF